MAVKLRKRKFPVQEVPLIPWELAEEAYIVYASKYGTSQSLERLAQRGGFGAGEMDMLYPKWRPSLQLIERLQGELENLKVDFKRVSAAGAVPCTPKSNRSDRCARWNL